MVEANFDTSNSVSSHSAPEGPLMDKEAKKAAKKAAKALKDDPKPSKKQSLVLPDGTKAFETFSLLKDRMPKAELDTFVIAVFAKVDPQVFDEVLDELTPLEWKLHTALADDGMREKLMDLLNGQQKH